MSSEAALPKRVENWVLSFQILRSWARTTGKMTGSGLELPKRRIHSSQMRTM